MNCETKEMFIRFANGAFTECKAIPAGVLLAWDKNINPLEVSGVSSKESEERFSHFARVDAHGKRKSKLGVFTLPDQDKNYLVIAPMHFLKVALHTLETPLVVRYNEWKIKPHRVDLARCLTHSVTFERTLLQLAKSSAKKMSNPRNLS